MGRTAAEDWIRAHVEPVGVIETAHKRPWATVLRVPLADSVAWFKACAPVQGFEPRLTAELFARWPDRVAEVLGHDEERAWLLLADAGTPIRERGNPPEPWLVALPLYAELQRGEAAHTHDHLADGVPDLRVAALPARYEDLLQHDLPLELSEIRLLREFAPRFAELCGAQWLKRSNRTARRFQLHQCRRRVRRSGGAGSRNARNASPRQDPSRGDDPKVGRTERCANHLVVCAPFDLPDSQVPLHRTGRSPMR